MRLDDNLDDYISRTTGTGRVIDLRMLSFSFCFSPSNRYNYREYFRKWGSLAILKGGKFYKG
jgi:hypothetical protein